MQQIWIPRTGGPEVLELRDAPDPQPGKGQVRIAVQASGVNFADLMARMGLYPDAPPLPAVVGYMAELMKLWAVGVLRPVVRATVPFSEAGRAHQILHDRQNVGKVVLVPDGAAGEEAR